MEKLIRINLRNNIKSLMYLMLALLIPIIIELIFKGEILNGRIFQITLLGVTNYSLFFNMNIEEIFFSDKNLLLRLIPCKAWKILLSNIISFLLIYTPIYAIGLMVSFVMNRDVFAYSHNLSSPLAVMIFLFLFYITVSLALSSLSYSTRLTFNIKDRENDENQGLLIVISIFYLFIYVIIFSVFMNGLYKYSPFITMSNSRNFELGQSFYQVPFFLDLLKVNNGQIILPYYIVAANIVFSVIMYFISVWQLEKGKALSS